MYIGLTGTISSGKGVVAEYFKRDGFEYFSLSGILRKIAEAEEVSTKERKSLQDFGNSLRKKYGNGYLAQEVCRIIRHNIIENAVIDGIRNPGEIFELRQFRDFYLISLDAGKRVRYKRMLERSRESDPRTWKEFSAMDARDLGKGEAESGQAVAACMKMADYRIRNEGTKEDLIRKAIRIHERMIRHGK
jgi:dephospho-CoA kinase